MVKGIGLKYNYNNGKELNFPDFECRKNEVLLILGNSGSGKTTLLNILGLLLNPDYGQLTIGNFNVKDLNTQEKTALRAKNIGIIFQKNYFINALNAKDNLLMANYLSNTKLDDLKAENLTSALGIHSVLAKKVTELSGGEQQRLNIARALMNEPQLILADEPTSSLDDENCERVIELLINQAQNINSALIIVTHDHRLKSKFNNFIQL